MFDALLRNPLVLALPPALSIAFAFALSRMIELIPKFASWWDKQSDQYKLAYRGWAGLLLAVLLVVFAYYTKMVAFEVVTAQDWLVLIGAVVISWLLFVAGAEGTYQVTKANLPRKQLPQFSNQTGSDHCCRP